MRDKSKLCELNGVCGSLFIFLEIIILMLEDLEFLVKIDGVQMTGRLSILKLHELKLINFEL